MRGKILMDDRCEVCGKNGWDRDGYYYECDCEENKCTAPVGNPDE